jgi:hypothetical protein
VSASIAAQLTADPLDPTYHGAPPVIMQLGGGMRGSGSSLMSDKDLLWILRDHCPALRSHCPAEGDASSWLGVTVDDAGHNGTRRVVEPAAL